MTRTSSASAAVTCGMVLCTWTACNVSLDDASSKPEKTLDAGNVLPPLAAVDSGLSNTPRAGLSSDAEVADKASDSGKGGAVSDAETGPPAAGATAAMRGDQSEGYAGKAGANATGTAGHGDAQPQGPLEAPGYIAEQQEPADKSKKCVEVMDAKQGDTASMLENRRIQFATCSKDPSPAQRWTFWSDHTIRAFDMCLTPVEKKEASRVFLELRSCKGFDTQFWLLCSGQLLNKAYGTCLDLMDEASRQNGGSVQLWTCFSGKANQSWQLPGALEEEREEACSEFPPPP